MNVVAAPMSTRPATRSGCSIASFVATIEPIEWPARIAERRPTASMNCTVSSTMSAIVYEPGRLASPCPRAVTAYA